ncbi:MAG: hypothetical protein V2A79_02935, partial [Planctomycetota bacterium]
GDAVSPSIGPRQAFVGGPASRNVTVGLSSSTATPGLKTGSLIVDNTELTSAGTGSGSADGDDTIQVQAEVLEHAEASFDALMDTNGLTIAFGTVQAGSGLHTQGFVIYNLESAPPFTAALDVDAIDSAGDTLVLYTDASVFSNLAAGSSVGFNAFLDASAASGIYQATYTFSVSDADLPGAQPGTVLVLTLTGEVVQPSLFPFDDDGDGDVDLTDFARFLLCLDGPAGGPLSDPCHNHDADGDDDVDLHDFNALQVLFTGG